jgi:hypothetical protein
MGTFTTKLKLGGKAFGVNGDLDPTIQCLTVGQIRVTKTMPRARSFSEDPCYKEEYMCVETGVGSGTIWTYGKNIFATKDEAQNGVIVRQQAVFKQRAERDAYQAEEIKRKRLDDLSTLERLKKQYEAA